MIFRLLLILDRPHISTLSAYFPDGAHADADELEPVIAPPGSTSTCADSMTCPAPMYYIGTDYKGTYSNNADLMDVTSDEDNFGLDDYEPLFFHPLVSSITLSNIMLLLLTTLLIVLNLLMLSA